jgi:protein-S-isoprenylcysteine O-methyltransferase Ste14
VAKVSTAPTEGERQILEKMARARHAHFVLLVILICLASISFLVPEDLAPFLVVGGGVLIILVGLSSMKLQYFQKCPRCSVRAARTRGYCAHCGLEFFIPKATKASKDST